MICSGKKGQGHGLKKHSEIRDTSRGWEGVGAEGSQGKENYVRSLHGAPGEEGRIQKNSAFGKDFPNPIKTSRSLPDISYFGE